MGGVNVSNLLLCHAMSIAHDGQRWVIWNQDQEAPPLARGRPVALVIDGRNTPARAGNTLLYLGLYNAYAHSSMTSVREPTSRYSSISEPSERTQAKRIVGHLPFALG